MGQEQEIYYAIKQAIIEQKMRPNMQLVEEVLAESFGVSRTPVRNVVRRLAAEKLVTIVPYKGAFVSCPTIQEARQVFEMRRVIEVAVVRKVCQQFSHDQYERLSRLIEEEHQAQHDGRIFEAIRITGDFHLRLAEASGNAYYHRYLEELISLSYVIIALYGEQKTKCCQDHQRILENIHQGHAEAAEQMMLEHLWEIEKELNFDEQHTRSLSLADIFQEHRQVGSSTS
ncbi:GntR family transcriptional regulator [Paenibacillus wulumuqiensis]|uniref:GntR family transcriptional regulator n=1 Tax=Paenibacillus wulumuqiensis TaxID=1567107 RepID=UPI00061933A2|nr:GntR family transcriptional regulator [Paenibacillus wulumuqiensis]